jgi:hypothetical protein
MRGFSVLTDKPCRHGVRENICAMCMQAYIAKLEMAVRDVVTAEPDQAKLPTYVAWVHQRLSMAVKS